MIQISDFDDYLEKLIDHLTKEKIDISLILEGSLKNEEAIPNYSDIDLRYIYDEKDFDEKTIARIMNINSKIDPKIEISQSFFPASYFIDKDKSFIFSYYRKFCLKDGKLLYGKDIGKNVVLPKITSKRDLIVIITKLCEFQIKLRGQYRNMKNNISNIEKDMLIKSILSTYFHSIRYFNAFYGFVYLSLTPIKNNIKKHKYFTQYNIDFFNKAYDIRFNWNLINRNDINTFDLLYEINLNVDYFISKVNSDINSCINKEILYIK